jgi:hypothetical protein
LSIDLEIVKTNIMSIESKESWGTPIILVQQDFPLNGYELIGGPADDQQRAELHRDVLRLARKITAIESPSLIPPSEAADRWIKRVMTLDGGKIELRDLMRKSRDFSRGFALHLTEHGKRNLALEFEKVAGEFENLLIQLDGGKLLAKTPRTKTQPKSRLRDQSIEVIRKRVKELRSLGHSHQEICREMGESPRPPHVAWRQLTWPNAYRAHRPAVAKWISDACSDLPSVTN